MASCVWEIQCLEYIKDFVAPDSVGISLKLNNHWLNIVCVYRSQNLSFAERTNLYNSLKEIKIKQNEELQVYGDFNLPNVNWDTSTVNCPINTVNPFFTIQRDFLEVLNSINQYAGVFHC